MVVWNARGLVMGFSLAVVACATTKGDDSGVGPTGFAPIDGGGGANQDGSVIVADTGSAGSDPWLSDAETCHGETQKAKQYPLDMYLLLDSSGSMADPASGTSETKWALVTSAIEGFVRDPKSDGLGLGLQYFPSMIEDLVSCKQSEKYLPCDDHKYICLDPDGDPWDGQCTRSCSVSSPDDCVGTHGSSECVDSGGGDKPHCTNVNCNEQVYATPQVPIAAIPGADQAQANALTDSMRGRTPKGGTPTLPALRGAFAEARSWVTDHSDHRVAVVLASDGEPTLCPLINTAGDKTNYMNDIANEASAAANGDPHIRTFVIGVLQAGSTATNDLNAIAQAGGTTSAFIIEPGLDLSTQFAHALDLIRGQALACEYQLPAVETGELDFMRVNVRYTTGDGQALPMFNYVVDSSACDPTTGGWHYDVDPSQGTPSRILLCSATCSMIQNDPSGTGQIDIQVGCKTQGVK